MDIVIIANFCMDFSEKDNGRFSYLAKELSRHNKVEIVTSDFYHITKRKRSSFPETLYQITYINEPGYKKNISLKRFVSHFIWGKNVEKYIKHRKKPDVIYCAVPSLTAAHKVARYCKKKKIRFVVDIQDLWPEAFQMIITNPVISKMLFTPLRIITNNIYKQADDIFAVSQTYVERALSVNKKCDTGHVVYLGTDIKAFDNNVKKYTDFHKEEGELWLAYCGTLGKSYDITCVIDALALLGDKAKNIKFIIMGDGPQQEAFQMYAQKKQIDARFVGRLPYDKMCALLSICDIAVNPIIGKSVASIINKHADYAASGLPVLNTQSSREYINLIESYQMGFNSVSGNVVQLAENLEKFLVSKELRIEMGANSRLCAEQRFDRACTYSEIVNILVNGDQYERKIN